MRIRETFRDESRSYTSLKLGDGTRVWKETQSAAARQTSVSRVGLSALRGVRQVLHSVFLPVGYPESVSDDYIAYQVWDSLQALCSSITGMLATQAILTGVGVGSATATPASAVIQWILRDGTGMLGRILFAWWQGSELDTNAKTWRLMADILNDLAMLLEMLAPLYSFLFTYLVCVASLLKSVVGVAGGATRAALTQHQARRNNMADVSAKDGSQETAVGLSGMLLGLLIMPHVDGQDAIVWALFAFFTFFHLYFNYLAVSAVTMQTLNAQRFQLTLQDDRLSTLVRYRDHESRHRPGKREKLTFVDSWRDSHEPVMPSPPVISKEESVLWWDKPSGGITIRLGSPVQLFLRRHCRGSGAKALERVLTAYAGQNFFLVFGAFDGSLWDVDDAHVRTTGEMEKAGGTIHVMFRQTAASEDYARGYFHALTQLTHLR